MSNVFNKAEADIATIDSQIDSDTASAVTAIGTQITAAQTALAAGDLVGAQAALQTALTNTGALNTALGNGSAALESAVTTLQGVDSAIKAIVTPPPPTTSPKLASAVFSLRK